MLAEYLDYLIRKTPVFYRSSVKYTVDDPLSHLNDLELKTLEKVTNPPFEL